MKLTKKDLQKLAIYAHFLARYLADWEAPNSFYYSDKYLLEILERLSHPIIGRILKSVKEANAEFMALDKEDRDHVKDVLGVKELHFQASPEAKSYYYNFAQEHYTIEDQRRADFTLEPLKCDKCGYIGEVSWNQETLEFTCAWCGETYK